MDGTAERDSGEVIMACPAPAAETAAVRFLTSISQFFTSRKPCQAESEDFLKIFLTLDFIGRNRRGCKSCGETFTCIVLQKGRAF